METSTHHDPAERWINRYTGEITAPLGDRDPADWLHATFKRDDPAEREIIESYFDDEKPRTTWTVYFDGQPSHWLMQEYPKDANGVLPGCKYGFLIVREEPQYPDLDTCASGFALVAAVECDFIEAKYRLDRDQRPYAVPSTKTTRPMKRPTSMQDYIIQALAGAIENQLTKATISYRFSNHGTLYAMRGFATIAYIEFDFQDAYCTLNLKSARSEVLEDAHLKYVEGKNIEAFIGHVAAVCRAKGP